jgi:hypothetical protein
MKDKPVNQTTAMSSGEFLTAAQLAARWMNSVTLATLATWRSRNTGPAYVKVGGKVLYRVSDVEAYEAKNTRSK